MPSVLANIRRLGWAGLINRAQVARADFSDWIRSRQQPIGFRIGLQPWRFAGKLRKYAIATIERGGKLRRAPRVVLFGEPGRKLPRNVQRQPRRLYRLRDAIVLPRHVILVNRRGTRVMPWSFFSGNSFHHPAIVNGNGDVWLANRLERGRSARVDGPVLIADSTHYDYGHVLLEVATRLAYLELCPAGTRVLTRQGIARSYSGLFDVMGVSADRLVTVEGPTFCEEVYFGDSLVDIKSFVSRAAWRSFERMGELAVRSSVATPERIYISRKGVARRPLVNEAEIERLFAAFGFTILAPETMPLEDQIKVFAGAKMIAGPRGSGLHNIVFSSPEARLLMLTFRKFILPIDPLLMRAHGTLAYAIGEETSRPRGKSYYHANWTIDPALVEGAIRSHFGL